MSSREYVLFFGWEGGREGLEDNFLLTLVAANL